MNDHPAPGMDSRVVFVQSSRMGHHPRHHYRLAAALRSQGYAAVTMAQPDLTPGHADAVPMEYLPLRRNRPLRMLSGPATMVRALRSGPAVVHVVCLDMLPWAVLARWLRRDVVVLYDSNEEYDTFMLIKEWLPRRMRRPLKLLVRWLEPWLARRLDAATTALPATHEKFTRAGVRSVLVRNFPPASIIGGQPRREPFDHDILIGGTLGQEQIPLLAATAGHLARLRAEPVRWLVVARDASDADRRLLEESLTAAGVRESFEIRYDLPFPEMNRVMRASRTAFIPYAADANYGTRVPIRIFEYMAAGVPFVAGDLLTTAEFVKGRGVAVIAPAGDALGYAEALQELLSAPARQEEMAARGPGLVRELFNWDVESRKLLSLYEELVGPPVSRSGPPRTSVADPPRS